MVTTVEEISSIGKAFSNATAQDKAGLVVANKEGINGWSLLVRTLEIHLMVVFWRAMGWKSRVSRALSFL